jgi:hypothetical protein
MRNVTTIAVVMIASVASAASFRPMTLREKAEKADLIVVGTVLSIRQVMPTNEFGYYTTDDETSYMGPTSIGVVEVSEVWKQKDGVTRFFRSGVENTAPRHIMVPCDYKFHEEPSDLTKDRKYVMFLRNLGANLYHPLDPASTHVIEGDRVAQFGMNHPHNLSPQTKTEQIESFKKSVLAILGSSRKGDKAESQQKVNAAESPTAKP